MGLVQLAAAVAVVLQLSHKCQSFLLPFQTNHVRRFPCVIRKISAGGNGGETSDHVKQYCTSIERTDAESEISKNSENRKPQRFIHPQVFKMFHRAQFLIKNGDNAVAQRLLLRCLELNPFDSHSWLALARLEAKLGNIDRAREVFSESITRCPNNVHILHAWGHLEQVSPRQ